MVTVRIEVSKNSRLKYEYDKIEITNMWANKMQNGDVHPPHTHSNNFLSGVYYLKSNNTAPIQFFDPKRLLHLGQTSIPLQKFLKLFHFFQAISSGIWRHESYLACTSATSPQGKKSIPICDWPRLFPN